MLTPTNFLEVYLSEEHPSFYIEFNKRYEEHKRNYGSSSSVLRSVSLFLEMELNSVDKTTSHMVTWLKVSPRDELRPEQWLSNFLIYILPFLMNEWL